MRNVIILPVVIGALGGAISVSFKEYIKQIGLNVRLEEIQKVLLGTAKILRKVLSLYKEEKERPGTRVDLL